LGRHKSPPAAAQSGRLDPTAALAATPIKQRLFMRNVQSRENQKPAMAQTPGLIQVTGRLFRFFLLAAVYCASVPLRQGVITRRLRSPKEKPR
jgi:hypothetical protein